MTKSVRSFAFISEKYFSPASVGIFTLTTFAGADSLTGRRISSSLSSVSSPAAALIDFAVFLFIAASRYTILVL
jgi:hypothetical protein